MWVVHVKYVPREHTFRIFFIKKKYVIYVQLAKFQNSHLKVPIVKIVKVEHILVMMKAGNVVDVWRDHIKLVWEQLLVYNVK
jgi:hypothetical protein